MFRVVGPSLSAQCLIGRHNYAVCVASARAKSVIRGVYVRGPIIDLANIPADIAEVVAAMSGHLRSIRVFGGHRM